MVRVALGAGSPVGLCLAFGKGSGGWLETDAIAFGSIAY
jgi:hypothetical protein